MQDFVSFNTASTFPVSVPAIATVPRTPAEKRIAELEAQVETLTAQC
ncbi:MAG: hypothetical protein QM811_16450 [Pirellulales bacterium]